MNLVKYSPFQSLIDGEGLCQGDIIVRTNNVTMKIEYGMLLTADCDLAHNKIGNQLSVLEIISAQDYIKNCWSEIESLKLFNKSIAKSAEMLNVILSKSQDKFRDLNQESLSDWLLYSGAKAILAHVQATPKEVANILPLLECAEMWLKRPADACKMKILEAFWNKTAVSEKNRTIRLGDSIHPNKSQGDIYFLPYLPNMQEVGFVVKLRSLFTVSLSSVYIDDIDRRVNGDTDGYYRIGRLSDGIRFSVVQRMANLFSRIGQPVEFEDESETAVGIVLDEIMSPGNLSYEN